MRFCALTLLSFMTVASGFSNVSLRPRSFIRSLQLSPKMPQTKDYIVPSSGNLAKANAKAALATALMTAPLLLGSAPADAYDAAASAIPAAFAAYGHYLGLVLVSMCLITEVQYLVNICHFHFLFV